MWPIRDHFLFSAVSSSATKKIQSYAIHLFLREKERRSCNRFKQCGNYLCRYVKYVVLGAAVGTSRIWDISGLKNGPFFFWEDLRPCLSLPQCLFLRSMSLGMSCLACGHSHDDYPGNEDIGLPDKARKATVRAIAVAMSSLSVLIT